MIIPGAAGIRTISRYQIFLTMPVIVIALWWLWGKQSQWPKILVVVLCGVLVLEEFNSVAPIGLDRFAEIQRLSRIMPPPATCHVFYASVMREGENPSANTNKLYSANVDAMLISEMVHQPTINGISTYNPPDWDFADPTAADYHDKVMRYVAQHNLQSLCSLNMQTLKWGM